MNHLRMIDVPEIMARAASALSDASGHEADVLPGIDGAACGWLSALQRRWPESLPLGLYPAFAS